MNTKNFLLYSVVIFILGVAIALRISWIKPEVKLPRNQPITFLSTVKSEPRISDRNQVIEIGDSRLYVDLFPRYRVGDRLRIEGEVDTKGNIFSAKVEKIGRLQVRDLSTAMGGLREKISKNISQILPSREATLVQGTVLGVDDIGRDFRDELIKTGTIHVVVVSGQNLAIVAGLFMALSKFIGRRQSLLLATIAVFLYAVLTGFEPPVIRASLMVLASSLAIYLGREVWSILNILTAALIIIFIWPGALGEISFQLTFAATLGISTLGSAMQNFLLKKFKKASVIVDSALQNAAIATSAYIFTAPIILYHFGQVSLVGPLVNILVAEAVAPIMILGFLIAIGSLIFMPLAQLIAYLAFVPAFYFIKVVDFFAKIPIEQINLGKGSIFMVISFYILIFGLMGLFKRNSKSEARNSK